MLVQISQVVKMIDMPHFSYLRIQLLDPASYPELISCFKGLIMLLP